MDSKIINKASSNQNGIFFYSNTNPSIGVKSFFDENNNIQTQIVDATKVEFENFLESKRNESNSFFKKHLLCIFNVTLIFSGLILTIVTHNFFMLFSAIYFCCLSSRELIDVLLSAIEMRKKNDKNYCIAEFHSAEHMAINAYEKLQRIPSLAEVKKFSRFSDKCGSRKDFNIIVYPFTVCVIWIITQYVTSPWFFFAIWSNYFLLLFLNSKFHILKFLQVIFTKPPSDEQLMLAIEGLRQFEILEEK